MSWLARSIANTLIIDDNDENDETTNFRRQNPPSIASQNDATQQFDDDLRGVKDDLSEFRESLTRQLWGVANFLAPPPNHPHSSSSPQLRGNQFNNDPSISGDEGEESPISITENGDSKIEFPNFEVNSSINVLGRRNVVVDDDDDWIDDVVGLTDEVLTFAGNIGHHPETWLDFPVEDDEDIEDFPMSESQKRHSQAIEHLTPRLAALRIELCPAHMSMGFFWKVYFVLLHSRLNKQDAELLSTPEVVEARAKWMQEQQKRAKKESEWYHGGLLFRAGADFDDDGTPRSQQNEHSETLSSWTFASEPATSSTTADSDVEKQAVTTEPHFMDKSINDEKPLAETNDKNIVPTTISKRPVLTFVDDEDDDWPEDDFLGQNERFIPVGIEDEVSFSDLEDDDCCIPIISKP